MNRIKKMGMALLIATLLAGCQATPETDIVVQKDMEQMIEKGMAQSETPSIAESPAETPGISYDELCAHYGVPERFEKSFSDQGVEVCADLAFELPDTIALPMARVEAAKFSQEQVSALFHTLCGDTPMYEVPASLDKESYQDAILQCQALLAAATNEQAKKQLNSDIEGLQKLYDVAPENIKMVPCDGTLKTRGVDYEETNAASGTQTYLDAISDPKQIPVIYSARTMPMGMRFTVYNDMDYANTDTYSYVDEQGNTQNFAPSSGSSVAFQRNESLCRYGLDGTPLADVTALSLSSGAADGCLLATTPQQARETVEKLMDEAGLTSMVIDRVHLYTSKEEAWRGDNIDYKMVMMEQLGIPLPDDQPETQGYVFRLLRQVNGVKVESDHDSSMTNMEGVAYGKEWMYEMLTVAVDDKGIANLYWTGPLNVTETLTEDTAIRPWNEIENVFDNMIIIQNVPYTHNARDLHIDVTRVCLCLQRIMERDSFTTGLLVPVWNFYGTRTWTGDNGDPVVMDEVYFPLLSVNAIDGSVINPLQGY